MVPSELNFQENTGNLQKSAGCWSNGSQKQTELLLHSHACPLLFKALIMVASLIARLQRDFI